MANRLTLKTVAPLTVTLSPSSHSNLQSFRRGPLLVSAKPAAVHPSVTPRHDGFGRQLEFQSAI